MEARNLRLCEERSAPMAGIQRSDGPAVQINVVRLRRTRLIRLLQPHTLLPVLINLLRPARKRLQHPLPKAIVGRARQRGAARIDSL